MTSNVDTVAAPNTFSQLVQAARSGLRRDIERLLAGLHDAELLVPLARDLPEAPEGERVELDGELTLVPHLLPDSEGQLFAALFTEPEPLEPIVLALGWTTDGEPLKVCALPARIALGMALDVMDDERVLGLVLDPGAPSELCLTRSELSSVLSGRAVPLIAYVANIPREERDHTLVAQPSEPPPSTLLVALSSFLESAPEVTEHHLERTFNPDRDLEPHLTLRLSVQAGCDRARLFREVTQALEGTIPPPGYLDVLFEEPQNASGA